MKKLLALLLAAIMVFTLVACNDSNDENGDNQNKDVTVRVMALKGPTGMGMVQLMENDKNGTSANDYEFTLAAAPTEVVAAIVKGSVDIAAIPVNLAAVLFNKADVEDISFAAVNTLGVLYLMENGNTITKLEDIKGKKIEAGAIVKLNAPNETRNTQTWKFYDNGDGTFAIYLEATDEAGRYYAIGLKDGETVLVTGDDIKTYGTWKFEAAK